jgi:hypothetical protein
MTVTSDFGAVDKYKVEWSIEGSAWQSIETTNTSAIISGLSGGTTYKVRVSAHSAVGWGEPSLIETMRTVNPPNSPSQVTKSNVTASSVNLSWLEPDANGLSVDKYKIEWSTNGSSSWRSQESNGLHATISGLATATAYQFRVRAHSDAGWGEASEVLDVFTTGTRNMRFTFKSSDGRPLTGGKISWETTNGLYGSASSYGATSSGMVDFPRVVAGFGRIKVSDIELANGTRVSGSWDVILGKSSNTYSLPEDPEIQSLKVKTTLPNSKNISGAQISVSGLINQISSGGFLFVLSPNQNPNTSISWRRVPASAQETGFTELHTASGFVSDENGEALISGFRSTSISYGDWQNVTEPMIATATYNDGILRQTKISQATGNTANVEFDEMPWLDLSIDSTLANENSLVSIPVTLHSPDGNNQIRGRNLAAATSLPSATVQVIPPAGATQGCKNKVLSARTNNVGRATLRVCATKSGMYKISGKGAASTGDFFLRVKGAPSLPVTSASGTTPALGTAKFSWNAPIYTGGASITGYKVTISGGGKTSSKTVTTKSVTFTSLKSATTYLARIQAITKNGLSDPVTVRIGVA